MSFRTVAGDTELWELVAGRRKAGALLTNFIFTDPRFAAAARMGVLLTATDQPGSLFLLRDEEVARLYYMAPSPNELVALIGHHRAALDSSFVIDILGPEQSSQPAAEALQTAGFAAYKTFLRMNRVGLEVERPDGSWRIELAREADAAEVHTLIRQEFDPFAEHLPGPDTVAEAARSSEILLLRQGATLLGFLMFGQAGATSLLRFIAVSSLARNAGIGQALVSEYLWRTRTCKRHQLWVWEENHPARRRYAKAGYRADGIVDRIFRFEAH